MSGGDDFAGRTLHFVGIGGAGMSGLALIAHELGAEVTGSDQVASSYTERLRERGIPIAVGHAAEHVPAGAELVYSTAVPASNPERVAAAERQLHRSELLAQIAALRRTIAITGTHGKTTTAAMVVHTLRGCGFDPAYVIGGELRATGLNAEWGRGEWIVIELGGTGLGLSIVKHIAQLHGGRVEAESELGKGTTIRLLWPVVTQT